MLALRRRFARLPSPPRCKLCYAPFHGIGGAVLKPWFGPWERNPQLCKNCMKGPHQAGRRRRRGRDLDAVRRHPGLDRLGERLGPAAFAALLTASTGSRRRPSSSRTASSTSSSAMRRSACTSRAMPGRDHARKAIDGGRRLIEATARSDASASGPIPAGGGVHTGMAYVGTLGSSEEISTSPPSATRSTRRRDSPRWRAGELLVSLAAETRLSSSNIVGLDRRTVEVRGREATLDVYALRAPPGSGDGETGD